MNMPPTRDRLIQDGVDFPYREASTGPTPQGNSGRAPRHVAVIMDANGRWAEQRGLNRSDGHSAGTENIRRVIEEFGQRGVEVLTIFAFSTENWKRPHLEVRGLMWLLSRTIDRELQPLHEAGVRLRYIGRLEVLDAGVRHQVERAVERTATMTG
jgi:undecaprenyl diphosphate synthase